MFEPVKRRRPLVAVNLVIGTCGEEVPFQFFTQKVCKKRGSSYTLNHFQSDVEDLVKSKWFNWKSDKKQVIIKPKPSKYQTDDEKGEVLFF